MDLPQPASQPVSVAELGASSGPRAWRGGGQRGVALGIGGGSMSRLRANPSRHAQEMVPVHSSADQPMPAVTATMAKYALQVASGTSAPMAQNRCGRLADGSSRRNSPST